MLGQDAGILNIISLNVSVINKRTFAESDEQERLLADSTYSPFRSATRFK